MGSFVYQIGFLEWYRDKKFVSENRKLRSFLVTIFGHKCAVCGITDWLGKQIVLEVDHIDGDSGNTKIENVRLICPNCHSQTETYKGKNRGKGRHSRRMRYHAGKSY